jgi:predicted ABC-type exoprotein transport system permease subunit
MNMSVVVILFTTSFLYAWILASKSGVLFPTSKKRAMGQFLLSVVIFVLITTQVAGILETYIYGVFMAILGILGTVFLILVFIINANNETESRRFRTLMTKKYGTRE